MSLSAPEILKHETVIISFFSLSNLNYTEKKFKEPTDDDDIYNGYCSIRKYSDSSIEVTIVYSDGEYIYANFENANNEFAQLSEWDDLSDNIALVKDVKSDFEDYLVCEPTNTCDSSTSFAINVLIYAFTIGTYDTMMANPSDYIRLGYNYTTETYTQPEYRGIFLFD